MKSDRNVLEVICFDWQSDFRFNVTFKMVAITSFHATKFCHLVSVKRTVCVCVCSNICQFLIYSTVVLFSMHTTMFSPKLLASWINIISKCVTRTKIFK